MPKGVTIAEATESAASNMEVVSPAQSVSSVIGFRIVIRSAVRLVAAVCLALALCSSAAASHLVTGNGLGFAVVAPESGTADKILLTSPQFPSARSG